MYTALYRFQNFTIYLKVSCLTQKNSIKKFHILLKKTRKQENKKFINPVAQFLNFSIS